MVRSNINLVKTIAHRYEVKVNDVLLAAVAGGVRALLQHRGEPVENLTLRAVVPVSLHDKNVGRLQDNRLGQLIAPLPLGVADPVRRLAIIAADTAAAKRDVRPRAGAVLDNRIVRWLSLRILARQRMFNIYVTDVPGPQDSVYFAGAKVGEIVPMLALMGNIAVGVGAFSYAGQFTISVVGDTTGCPEVDIIARGIDDTLQSLATAHSPTPSQAVGCAPPTGET